MHGDEANMGYIMHYIQQMHGILFSCTHVLYSKGIRYNGVICTTNASYEWGKYANNGFLA